MRDKIYFIRQKENPFGGAENYLLRLTNELKKQNISYEIIHLKSPSFLASWLKAVLFNMQVCFRKRGFYFSLDRITCPDIYRAGDGVHKIFLQTKKRKFNPLNFVYLYLEKKTFTEAKIIIANSKMVKKQITDSYKIDPKKIKVIYNGIEIENFDEKSSHEKINKEFNLDPEKKVILFVGSGFERKGVKEFLLILSKLKSDFYAFIIGKDKNLNYYKDFAKKLNLSDHIFFTGAREDVKDFYIRSDIFLFPPKYEPFSNVVLEAMSYKNAVITTEQNGASEILEKLFVMKNPNDFTIIDTVKKLLTDEKYLQKIKEKNYKLVQNFTIEKNAKETLEVIKDWIK